ncbi:Fc receptor 3 [Pelobates cultripes]|uniref:Fc receptor 3 n=1 Tax=Pelobates cultripes TaxID=61616 RepID=A0AAD1TH23_PELCU|nr:Fc receptor 3 [Pelobates cultripes]
MTEGVEITLTCDTIPRYPTNLRIAFYRDEEMVQGFSSSNKYQVQSARLEDSRNHTCEVRTSNYNVKKRSNMLHINIIERKGCLTDNCSVFMDSILHPLVFRSNIIKEYLQKLRLHHQLIRNIEGHFMGWKALFLKNTRHQSTPECWPAIHYHTFRTPNSPEKSCHILNKICNTAGGLFNMPIRLYAPGYTNSEGELFSPPKIKVSLQKMTEGAEMTLTCDTIPRYPTNLLFAFYRDEEMGEGGGWGPGGSPHWAPTHHSRGPHPPLMGICPYSRLLIPGSSLLCRDEEMVQGFSSSNKYQVQSARLEDSRNHTCEVRTSNYNAKKRSNMLHINIIELFSPPKIKVSLQKMTEGAEMTLTCDKIPRYPTNLLFAFYRDEEMVQGFGSSNRYQVQSSQVEDSGNYICESTTAPRDKRSWRQEQGDLGNNRSELINNIKAVSAPWTETSIKCCVLYGASHPHCVFYLP